MTTTATASAPTTAFPSGRWKGHWIGPTPDREIANAMGVGVGLPAHEFERVVFRREFEVGAVPVTAPLRLTADSRYVLFVNGSEVGRGPVRSQPRRLRYDEYDIASSLVEGVNTLALIVTYYGHANAFWQPAASSGGFGADAILVLEAQVDDDLLVSDADWRVQRPDAWSVFETAGIDGVPVEGFDARKLPVDWAATGFDDSGWDSATVMAVSHIGGFAVSQPPTDPYGALLPRGIAQLTDEVREPATVIDSSARSLDAEWRLDHPAFHVTQVLEQTGGAGSAATTFPMSASVAPGTVHHVGVDFGRIVAGYIRLDVDAPAGTVFDLYFRELPWQDDADPNIPSPSTSTRFIARGPSDSFEGLELNGLRFVHLVVSAPDGTAGSDVVIRSLTMRERHYPESGESFFRSDDAEIDALYWAGRRTVSMNAFDAFTDCPTREQRAWVGDGVVHQTVHLTTNSDWRLAANYVELGASPRPDGMLPMTVVGEIEYDQGVTIPDWALHWVHGVHNLYRYQGDRAAILRYLPVIEGVLRWYTRYLDEHGTLSDLPEWNLVDWASVFSTGRSSIVTALWGRALREYAELCRWVGNEGSAGWADELWEAARVGFEDFWDASRSRYVDHFVDGERMPAASQAAGATAIAAGFAPEDRWQTIVDGITDPSTLVVRSWIGGDGGYDMAKIADQIQGIQRIDWDADREVVIAQPFFSYLVHDAIAQAGRGGDLVTHIRRWSQYLVDGYDTFGECWGWGTPVHGWSSTPTKDLVQHVLGVQPAEPGFGVVRVAPRLGTLRLAEGSVPSPFGPISVRVEGDRVTIDSPVPVVLVARDGTESSHPAGAVSGTI